MIKRFLFSFLTKLTRLYRIKQYPLKNLKICYDKMITFPLSSKEVIVVLGTVLSLDVDP